MFYEPDDDDTTTETTETTQETTETDKPIYVPQQEIKSANKQD